MAICDPKTNKIVVNKNKIKQVTLEYCMNTLANNKPEQRFEEEIRKKKERVKELMTKKDGDFTTDFETFQYNLRKFTKSGKKNYDFLTKGGKNFQLAVFKLCKRMIEEEVFPLAFQNTTLHMVFKGGKGRPDKLSDNRFIHCKEFFPRATESLIVEGGLKEPLLKGS